MRIVADSKMGPHQHAEHQEDPILTVTCAVADVAVHSLVPTSQAWTCA
jgi:hypothetical protein